MRSICHHMDLEEDNDFKLQELNYTPTLQQKQILLTFQTSSLKIMFASTINL